MKRHPDTLKRYGPLASGGRFLLTSAAVLLAAAGLQAQTYPPRLPGGQTVASIRSDSMLRITSSEIRAGARVAETAPEIDVFYFPGQDYSGDPWANWGDVSFAGGKFFATVDDHLSPRGSAMIYVYDPDAREVRMLANVRRFLEFGDPSYKPGERLVKGEPVQRGPDSHLHEGENYTPGKIHSRIDMGRDGWLYYSTHRGSPRTTTDDFGYRGDWIMRTHPETGATEILSAYPLAKHVIPAGLLDPRRLIYYGGTQHGRDSAKKGTHLIVFDIEQREVRKIAARGFHRYAILDPESGRLFWRGRMYDPETNIITEVPTVPDVRSATMTPTAEGWVYGTTGRAAEIWAFNVKTHEYKVVGNGAVGSQTYVTSMEIDPYERYLYYVPGAHGGGERDGTPVIQYDLKTKTPKVLAFMFPVIMEEFGFSPDGTFGLALDDAGARLFINWNGNRTGQGGAANWDACLGMVIHIPESERLP